MNTLAIDLYKQAIDFAYKTLPADSANPMTHTFQAVVAGTFAELIVAECIALREKVEIVGINSDEYEEGSWNGLRLYQDYIKRHFGVEERTVPILSADDKALFAGIASSESFTIKGAKKHFGIKE